MVTKPATPPLSRPVRTRAQALKLRQAPFALRIVRRSGGEAAIVYRRSSVPPAANARTTGGRPKSQDRLRAVGAMAPLAFAAATPLIRGGLKAMAEGGTLPKLQPGPSLPLDHDWGARIACFARVAAGLRDAGRLARAADALYHASGPEAAWWLGLMEREGGTRAVRALRILTEATA